MYIPSSFRMDDRAELLAFMRAHPFATLVSWLPDGPIATHLPVVIEEHGEALVITGHVARQNPHAAAFDGRSPSLVIFTGPHAYVPAALYEHAENVPTWNYIAVHATGAPHAISMERDRARMDGAMHDMVDTFDPAYHAQYAALSERFREGMLKGITLFALPVTHIEGKAKLSQNRNPHDQASVAAHLLEHEDPAARATGEAMRSRQESAHDL
ncbi:MAG: FMN-binding negative transcriptional regulator [Gemmatimonadaceae bacterium]|jgi:transcriptional regulator|nr:FMN-binding negative transcriptional regulator [Gemmatimonadaceae bacterium]